MIHTAARSRPSCATTCGGPRGEREVVLSAVLGGRSIMTSTCPTRTRSATRWSSPSDRHGRLDHFVHWQALLACALPSTRAL